MQGSIWSSYRYGIRMTILINSISQNLFEQYLDGEGQIELSAGALSRIIGLHLWKYKASPISMFTYSLVT